MNYKLSILTFGLLFVSFGNLADSADVISQPLELRDIPRGTPSSGTNSATVTEINVEVDYMVSAHSHALTPSEILVLEKMFACQGITLTIDQSDAIPETLVLENTGSGVFNNATPNGYLALKNEYFDHAGIPGWHYCIMAHWYESSPGQQTTSSGLAEILGDDFIVTLGSFTGGTGSPFEKVGTFAHELGHNLGLTHAGDQNEGVVTQYKPNYPSVMAYRYQLSGVRQRLFCEGTIDSCMPFRHLDYSRGTLPALDENALDEVAGVGYGPVDWNCDGVIQTTLVLSDFASYPCGGGGGEVHSKEINTDYDDWSNITDVTFALSREELSIRETVACITFEESQRSSFGRSSAFNCSEDPPASLEPCQYKYVDSDGDGIGDNCDNCSEIFNPLQTDDNADQIGDVCPHATISADTTIGMVPFTVAFSGGSDLTVSSWLWDFGDTHTSSAQNDSHSFETVGFYDISLAVNASEGDYTAYKSSYIKALADTLVGLDTNGAAGSEVRFDIYAANTLPLKQVIIPFTWFGSLNLALSHASISGLRSESMNLALINIDPFAKKATYSLTSTADTLTSLGLGSGPVLSIYFDIPSGELGSNLIELGGYSGIVPTFVSDELTYNPLAVDGEITTGCCVIPGDANSSGSVNISDATFLIALIFSGGAPPACYDQADANGSGSINIADATYIIGFIFSGGSEPICGSSGS